MKATALMVFVLLFLTSVIAHADHLVVQEITIEQQDCQLCNQGIDSPSALSQVKAAVVSRYSLFTAKVTITEFMLSQFVQPPLRAPPFIQ